MMNRFSKKFFHIALSFGAMFFFTCCNLDSSEESSTEIDSGGDLPSNPGWTDSDSNGGFDSNSPKVDSDIIDTNVRDTGSTDTGSTDTDIPDTGSTDTGSTDTGSTDTGSFRGVNWADERDNFLSGIIYVSGLSSSDDYNSASIVADRIISQFKLLIGTNSVRMPINEATISDYWDTYTGAIDVALTKGKVVLCYWAHTFGAKPRSMDGFWAMWRKIVDKYDSDPNCYFEVYNEPANFSRDEILGLYAEWLERFPSVPHGRIILNGTGAAQNVPDVGRDSRFRNCLLAVHDYSFFGYFPTEEQWEGHLSGQVGDYVNRTIMTEFGAPMRPGNRDGNFYDYQDYNQPPGSYFVAYYRGMSSQLREWGMGSFYWPGLRDGDWYSMTVRDGSGPNITLTIPNQSGLDRLHHSWGD